MRPWKIAACCAAVLAAACSSARPDPEPNASESEAATAERGRPCDDGADRDPCHHHGRGHDCRCRAPYADCDGLRRNGCETDTSSDVSNCGACGNACPAPGGSAATCVGGVCGFVCEAGLADCDGDPANGCEAELASDPRACGACGTACPAPAHAVGTCVASACSGWTCEAGWSDCDGDPANGCEVDTASDPNNCRLCGFVCPPQANATATCASGCGIACSPGWADCNRYAPDGCEVNIASSPTDCGGCGVACPTAPNVATTCTAGVCGFGACAMGYHDCDGDPANGCEVYGFCPGLTTIQCETLVMNPSTGATTYYLYEPNVAVRSGATSGTIDLLSEGTRIASVGYPPLSSTPYLALTGGPSYVGVIVGAPFSANTTVTVDTSGGEATLTAFFAHARPRLTQVVGLMCSNGTTTILPAP